VDLGRLISWDRADGKDNSSVHDMET
jgi:hypothetical protein